MTKQELLKALEQWPDDAEVIVCINDEAQPSQYSETGIGKVQIVDGDERTIYIEVTF